MSGTRFNAKKEFTQLRDQVNKVLEDTLGSSSGIALDIYETNEAIFIATSPLYGLQIDTLDIAIQDKELTISGETVSPEPAEDHQYLRRERKFGKFSRTVTLPGQFKEEEIKAQFKDHIVLITIPKVAAQPRVIKVTSVS